MHFLYTLLHSLNLDADLDDSGFINELRVVAEDVSTQTPDKVIQVFGISKYELFGMNSSGLRTEPCDTEH